LGADFGERQFDDSFGRCLSLQDFNSPVCVGIEYRSGAAVVYGGFFQMFDRFEFANSQNGLRRAKHGGVPPDNNKSLVSIGPLAIFPERAIAPPVDLNFSERLFPQSMGISTSDCSPGRSQFQRAIFSPVDRNLDVAAGVRTRTNSNGKLFNSSIATNSHSK
jgi:hypothetical protein